MLPGRGRALWVCPAVLAASRAVVVDPALRMLSFSVIQVFAPIQASFSEILTLQLSTASPGTAKVLVLLLLPGPLSVCPLVFVSCLILDEGEQTERFALCVEEKL